MMLIKRCIFIIGSLLLLSCYVFAQQKTLVIHLIDTDTDLDLMKRVKNDYKDSLQLLKSLNEFQVELHKAGYLAASVDDIRWQNEIATAYIHVGKPYMWAKLEFDPPEKALIKRVTYKEKYFRQKPISLKELSALEEEIIRYGENNGHPFARVILDSLSAKENKFTAKLLYLPGPRIVIDSIEIIGNSAVKKDFIASYSRLREGEPFSQKRVEDANYLLKNIQAVKVTKAPSATFYNNKSVIQLHLNKRKNNQFYGVVGILPNEGNEGNALVTGEVKLHLTNVFNSAKVISGEWKSLKPESQFLDLEYEHPNFLRTNIDVNLGLNLLKEDTTFLNVERAFAFRYNFGKSGSLSLLTRYKTGRLLSTDQYNVTNPPEFLDTDYWSYGFKYQKSSLDDIYQPKKGIFLELEAVVGNKRVKENVGLSEELYADINLNSFQLNAHLEVQQYHQLGKQAVLAHNLRSGTIQNENIALNEAYRIGGFQTLRGFVENEFYATTYFLSNLEYRLFTDDFSYVFLLYDQAYIIRDTENDFLVDYPLGLGAGINLLTPAGYLTFIYSVGTAKNQPMSFNRSKIHFGLVSIF